jgi:hypothetical protein
MDPGTLEFWEWFYEAANEGRWMSSEERRRAAEERWQPDLVVVQTPDLPDTAGEFHGYEGLAAVNRELFESWESIEWRPVEVEDLGGGRYLVLLETSGRSRSGVELGGRAGDLGHIVTLRDRKAARLVTYRGWDAARRAAGLD